MRIERIVHQLLGRGRVREVTGASDHPGNLPLELLEPVRPARRGDHRRSGTGQHAREARTETTRRPGHERDPAVEAKSRERVRSRDAHA